MKAIVLGILTITSISGFATVEHYYIHCEKTYVDPEVIDLHERKIKFKSLGETYQTSAIYSDEHGLYYQDYLENHEQVLSTSDHSTTLNMETDEQLDPFVDLIPTEKAPIDIDQNTESLILEENKTAPAAQQLSSSPEKKRAAWPYTNKKR
ncbi:MAG: hypothetical protein H7A41_07680 [Chlamydiales bacterium]|nr:hypothetical protein [Chlamydiales bacterium]